MSQAQTIDLSIILNGTALPIFVVDPQGRFVFSNRACEQLTGQSAESVPSTADLAGQTAMAEQLRPPPEVFHGREVERTVELPTSDGGQRSRRVLWQPCFDVGGELIGVMGLITFAGGAGQQPPPETDDLMTQVATLRQRLIRRYGFDQLIGQSPIMQAVLERVKLAAECDVPVLIRGEPGTGKELVAHTVHYSSRRQDRPLVALDCATLPPEVLERALERQLRPPSAEEPSYRQGSSLGGGSLLLQEVAALARDVQARLMSLWKTVGGSVRLLATTRGDLAEAHAQERVRDDLYYALSVFVIELPPLRQRREDVALLAQHFLSGQNARGGGQVRAISPEALQMLGDYNWPGNVQELADMIAAAHERVQTDTLQATDLPFRVRGAQESVGVSALERPLPPLDKFLTQVETKLIQKALARARGNKSRAAELLGISRPRLYRRMQQLGIEDSGPAA